VKLLAALVIVCACGNDPVPPLATAEPGVVFTYPNDKQVDVPLGTRIVVTFSDPVVASALTGGFSVVGPQGPVEGTPAVVGDGRSVELASTLAPDTTYSVIVKPELAPTATNLGSTLLTFRTRSERPRAAPPTLVAVNGGDPAMPEAYRPMLDTSTIELLFSEPLDTRTVTLGSGSVELVDDKGAAVAATLLCDGIHVVLDPKADLAPGVMYQVRLGTNIADLGGQHLGGTTVKLSPRDTRGAVGPIHQVLRVRQEGDPGPATSRAGAKANEIAIDKPIIGKETSQLRPASLAAELGDPKVLGGPIAFRIPRGQRLHASGLNVQLGGQIPTGLDTGDIEIELLTDAGGRIYRNPHQPAEQRPEDLRAPLYVDLTMDVGVYAVDPKGNAVLAQTVLGVQATGTATGGEGALAIETVTSMDLGLLGVTRAPTNLVLELITDTKATATADADPPSLVATFPNTGGQLPVDHGIDLVFSEPIDLDRARAGGVRLETTNGAAVPAVIESHGAAIVVRPLALLADGGAYRVVLSDVADVAGNKLPQTTLDIRTQPLGGTSAPMEVEAIHPGVPCALTGGNASTPGRCAGGKSGDDTYHPFTLAANEPIEVVFSHPAVTASVVLGATCNAGSVRVETVDGSGACTGTVPGTLLQRDRSFAFVPDVPWTPGTHYRLTLVSGANSSCSAGELCGISGNAASFDPLSGLAGSGASGGPNLVVDYTAGPPSSSTFMIAETAPYTDLNGSGTIDGGETKADANRVALKIVNTTGAISSAHFNDPDCIPGTTDREGCLYLAGAMAVELGEVTTNCPLPGGQSAPACVPVVVGTEIMYATTASLHATAIIGIDTDTGTSVLRVREPASGPVTGYIIDRGGVPTLVLALDVYMDAPDMSVALSDHDLHSKPLSLVLEGPLTFTPDGRIAIGASNIADVPVSVHIDAPLGISGDVQMIVPKGEMKMQLVSRPLRAQP
jgi:hypothetical protein